jgi:hypothetical protein
MYLWFDAHENRLQKILKKYLHVGIQVHMWSEQLSQVATVLESECRPRESNSVSFLSVVPKQQKRAHVSIV